MNKLYKKLFLLLSLAMKNTGTAFSSLQAARELEAPVPQATEYGEMEGGEFWEEHASLLRKAWKEWESNESLPTLNLNKIVDVQLRQAVQAAWRDPSQEDTVQQLWTQVAPNVYRCQLLDPNQISDIRKHIDGASYQAHIPTRRPNGMNRYGLILHPTDTDGAVSLTEFDRFYHELIDTYVRPMGRLLFQKYVGPGDDHESYAFTIRYKHGEDLALNEHSDASLYTLNVNLNTADEEYHGSTVYFVDNNGIKHNVTFEPGMALLHTGMTRHAALPLQGGTRVNMVVWMYGEHGYVRIAPYEAHEQLSPEERWTIPKKKKRREEGYEL